MSRYPLKTCPVIHDDDFICDRDRRAAFLLQP
ncbi:hypothetical protein EE612_051560 [Oryza sativa]|nr:hypothetical protein EE612_051560 [Oryza sativa]